MTDDRPVRICLNPTHKIKTKDKIKTRYYLELLTPETMKLLASIKSKIIKHENDENVFHLEIAEVVFVHCSIVNNNYQPNSRVLYIFAPNKSFVQLLDISPKNVLLKVFIY